jgi:integrase
MREHHIDLRGGWLQYPRPKTGINRRAKLWPQTVRAIEKALDGQRKAKQEQYRDLVFFTRCGAPWGHEDKPISPISSEFRKLLEQLKLYRRGRSFYALRHVFRTIADETKDQPAIDLVMGHARGDIASEYRERISDERLQAVADHVRTWLFGNRKPK